MKKIYVFTALSALLISCSTESDLTGTEVTDTTIKGVALKAGINPGNSANPYDGAGRAYGEILDNYLDGNYNDTTVGQVYNRIIHVAAANGEFSRLQGSPYIPQDITGISSIISAENSLQEILNGSGLSPAAQASLSGFVDDLLLHKDTPFEDTYEFITGYEAGILANKVFTADDKRVLLTTASVERYAADGRKRRKDHDWELLVTGIAGTIEGAATDAPSAVITSLTVGISINTDAD
jgi:hypothetical protein